MSAFVIATFYKFAPLPDYAALRQPLLDFCRAQGIKGTVLLAQEGMNSTLAGTRAGIDALLDHLRADPRFADLEHKESILAYQPFDRMKVRLKKEIVTLGVPGVNPNQRVGTYVEPEAWNALITDPDVLLIDTRNDYEVQIGTFKGALNPKTESFGALPAYVQQQLNPQHHKKVAMFCTGGIRCEKATAFMLAQGFEEVYHLKGGILRYLERIPPEQSLWEGECFVFDQRVSVDHHLQAGAAFICPLCKAVVPAHATCAACEQPQP